MRSFYCAYTSVKVQSTNTKAADRQANCCSSQTLTPLPHVSVLAQRLRWSNNKHAQRPAHGIYKQKSAFKLC